jgi:hypothetical protein
MSPQRLLDNRFAHMLGRGATQRNLRSLFFVFASPLMDVHMRDLFGRYHGGGIHYISATFRQRSFGHHHANTQVWEAISSD